MSKALASLWEAVHELLPPRASGWDFGAEPGRGEGMVTLAARLGVRPYQISDLTSALGVDRGRVFGVRWDLTTNGAGFKQPVAASLLLFHLWRRQRPPTEVTTLIDAGNINTCLALLDLGRRLDLSVEHVLSRHFPSYIRDFLKMRGGQRLSLVTAPPSAKGKEREFYSHLLQLMYEGERRRTEICLWHARYGGIAVKWMGVELARSWEVEPDDIVLGLGAGSTLEGFALPLKRRFGNRPRIVLAEHELTGLLDVPVLMRVDVSSRPGPSEYRDAPETIPHAVIGPHYDEVNPLISKAALHEIAATVRFTDGAWQSVSRACRSRALGVGNSSAANLAVAAALARQGRVVFTYVYEELRPYYLCDASLPTLSGARDVVA